jgi:hypothetical protein
MNRFRMSVLWGCLLAIVGWQGLAWAEGIRMVSSDVDVPISTRIDGVNVPPSPPLLAASPPSDSENEAIFQQIVQKADRAGWQQQSMGEILQAVSAQLLGAQYKAGLLDRSETEELFISLTEFDCLLFVETVLAIARGIAQGDNAYPAFVDHVAEQRYRDGQPDGYCSRLHYFADWIASNQGRGIVKDIAPQLGGVAVQPTLNFMSTHKDLYPRLAHNAANYRCIVEMEAQLRGKSIHSIPGDRIRNTYDRLQAGDIVGITTSLEGLDVTHTGLVYRSAEGGVGFIHASPGGSVRIAPDLQTFVEKVDYATGILVVRPTDPRQVAGIVP